VVAIHHAGRRATVDDLAENTFFHLEAVCSLKQRM
jgi:hypothetical protein